MNSLITFSAESFYFFFAFNYYNNSLGAHFMTIFETLYFFKSGRIIDKLLRIEITKHHHLSQITVVLLHQKK